MKNSLFTPTIKTIIIAGIVGIIFVIIPYVINFYNNDYSNRSEDWAQFGDYIGGTLNPILAFINLIVFILFTQRIQNLTNLNHEKVVETSREIAILSLKFDELKEFKVEMVELMKKFKEELDYHRAKELKIDIIHLIERMDPLFPGILNAYQTRAIISYLEFDLGPVGKGMTLTKTNSNSRMVSVCFYRLWQEMINMIINSNDPKSQFFNESFQYIPK